MAPLLIHLIIASQLIDASLGIQYVYVYMHRTKLNKKKVKSLKLSHIWSLVLISNHTLIMES